VTEFDDLFQLCFVAMARAVVQNAIQWRADELEAERALGESEIEAPVESRSDRYTPPVDLDIHDGDALDLLEPESDELIAVLEQLTEVMLGSWLSHSRTLRLSVLETIDNR